VYNGDIGSYLKEYENKLTFFIFPLYNNELFEDSNKKLMIYGANNIRLNFIENTYLVDGDIIKILSNANVNIIDNGENEYINTGDGYTSSDPSLIMSRNSMVTDNEIYYTKDTQLSGAKKKDRRDGVSKATYLNNESNLYKFRSKIIKNSMAIYQITWNYCDMDLLYPGMPSAYIYEDEVNGIMELKGVVISTYYRYNEATKTTSGLINLAVEKPIIEEEQVDA
jgi:hypothetical protein